MGIRINNVISVTFVIGSFLAAVGSMLYFSNYPGVVPTSGGMPGLKAFVAQEHGHAVSGLDDLVQNDDKYQHGGHQKQGDKIGLFAA